MILKPFTLEEVWAEEYNSRHNRKFTYLTFSFLVYLFYGMSI